MLYFSRYFQRHFQNPVKYLRKNFFAQVCYHRVIIGHININSIRNKFEPLVSFINNDLGILMISEIKTDDTFPDSQFLIKDFSVPYRLDRTAKGEGFYYISERIYLLNV